MSAMTKQACSGFGSNVTSTKNGRNSGAATGSCHVMPQGGTLNRRVILPSLALSGDANHLTTGPLRKAHLPCCVAAASSQIDPMPTSTLLLREQGLNDCSS